MIVYRLEEAQCMLEKLRVTEDLEQSCAVLDNISHLANARGEDFCCCLFVSTFFGFCFYSKWYVLSDNDGIS